MPFKAPESYALDRPEDAEPLNPRASDDEDDDDVDALDPLKGSSRRPYRDSDRTDVTFARQPLRWLDGQRRSGGFWRRLCIPSRFCCILVFVFFGTLFLLLSAGGLWVYKNGTPRYGESEPWYPSPRGGTVKKWADSYKKAADLVRQMTLVEKVNVTTGTGWSMDLCVGNTGQVPRLDFPSLCLQDGPLGLRFADNATAWPAGITVGATWNKELMHLRGKAHGLEARLKGIHVLLGPAMGPLGRLPAGGRNWEGFGADPVLQGVAAAQTIKGIQESGVIATAKHLVGNEQEHFRQSWEWGTPNAISSGIDDRTLHEIYAWPFAESVRAGVGSVMCSYNQVNNSYACQNSKLLNGILKDELGFQGFIQSDWLAQRSGVASALSGLDMSMPGDGLIWQDGKPLWGHELTKAVLNGTLPMERLDDMVLRIAAAWYQMEQDDEDKWSSLAEGGKPNFSSWTDAEVGQLHPGASNSQEKGVVNKFVEVRQTEEGGDHDDLARTIAREGIVLLKNDKKALPISRNGSALESGAQDGKIRIGVFGEDAFPNPDGPNACPDRGCNDGTLAMGWGSGAAEFPYLVSPAEALHSNFDMQTVEVTDWKTNKVEHVDGTAAAQDVCLVFVNSDSGEGYISWNGVKGDRNDLLPQKGGNELVTAVAANCGGQSESGAPLGKTIVVVHAVGPVILEDWIEHVGVHAVLVAHLPGQESGNALADIIFGDFSPSGHLPYTIARSEENYGPDSGILRIPNGVVPQQNFSEGLYFDYRYFDKHSINPRYEFGYGMSYTTFELSEVHLMSHAQQGVPVYPAARATAPATPPEMNSSVPDPKDAMWPKGLTRLKGYIYPYITSLSDGKGNSKEPYPYPDGYSEEQHALSQAGGDEGGNPDLYHTIATVEGTLTNTGDMPGDAVVQVYISYPADVKSPVTGQPVDMPVKVLRQFEKLHTVTYKTFKIALSRKDLSYWDIAAQNWVLPSGKFTVSVGWSSRDLPVKETLQVKAVSSLI
ncbi:glycoside hydrolase family 3 protein [Hortaea werneckii]|nr:glycoside hydrolase family 3 protein [Hortaea werneckii]KAI7103078.1 glycoside hydrolase family 3 protein [Hortaea werneckii]KAI7245173.1 glycoside hydrolase family 3 protein [Hortaea werneckii]KAI7332461.1 glycoside hydrolase family 3 protein [Hortaea werneckii]KAI7375283.1 glycoside hydrolase family 3 protein [Hortaea werneckii]